MTASLCWENKGVRKKEKTSTYMSQAMVTGCKVRHNETILLMPDQVLNIKHISNSPSTVTLTAALVPKGKCTTGKLCPFRRLGKDGCLYIHFSRKKLRCHGLFSVNKSKLKNPIVILSFWWPHNLIRYGPFSY